MTKLLAPLQSLKQGNWFKLICGASFQHLPAVRSLTLAYTLAGADCIDVAADPAVINAAQEALLVAKTLVKDAQARGFNFSGHLPLLMVSLNDGEDPHFRKAQFNPIYCPQDCPRPCEKICPAQAIVFNNQKDSFSGIIAEKCYGCGRCIPVCPYEIIDTASYLSTPGAIAPLIMSTGIDAIEIHTKVGRLAEFQRLWEAIAPWADQLKLLAISCNDGDGLIDYLQTIYDLISPRTQTLIWQTDGRSMSGDIGNGTTIAAIKLGQKVLAANLPGYVQLAGGTNSYTVPKLKAMGLLNDFRLPILDFGLENDNPKSKIQNPKSKIAGVAYGSYARVLLSSVIDKLENQEVSSTGVKASLRLEDEPELLWQAVKLADSLVSQIKSQ
ncbi:4Fe-4S binding protein [Sphaerospermopsis kisseleviana CS-549]|uniref:4Fe-4S binding protein n=1 Tax=Sphaerospermopsis kisseleviana CS-549 TaxID=3021783 RepID=A0ABT4ZYT1_9CYAN|nr:LdpA C-terminal domain-containing domain [Sphaerospermopsis kisseleviana]MDB9444584.1 4Fe-4S binding protein [Sphaerospermopsis kisseleviana CS-549]BAZ80385.1 4Fe-4S ferredoxin, iron-sulfur binding protein [Sphaerospermopsis kisseleviana NIES-73]